MRSVAVLLILSLCISLAAVEKEPLAEYQSRRARVADRAHDGVVVLFAAPDEELVRYFQEPNFYYLTGFDEPHAALVIDSSARMSHDYFFIAARNRPQERWTGEKLGPGSDAEKLLGIQSVREANELPDFLRKISARKPIFTLRSSFDRVREMVPDAHLEDIGPAVAELRQIKSASEIALLEKAIHITTEAEEAAARTVGPGVMEYEVEAAVEYEFRRSGAERPGFPSIVGSGPFSTVLHYDKSARRMEAGEVVVVDIGAEYSGYSADVTRTYPVSGKFSPRQREIYQIVLAAQKAALTRVKPGALIREIHQAALDYIRSKGYEQYFIHGTSHHIGLEVHDVGSTTRPLEANMVITVEPGIYIPEEKIGIRIEDDVLVTPTGYRILSDFPREAGDIEALVQKRN